MTMSRSAARPQRRRARFLPPAAGGAQKTGWEALDKWVGSGGAAPAAGAPAEGGGRARPAGRRSTSGSASGGAAPAAGAPAEGGAEKTGWEALDKWVGVR